LFLNNNDNKNNKKNERRSLRNIADLTRKDRCILPNCSWNLTDEKKERKKKREREKNICIFR